MRLASFKIFLISFWQSFLFFQSLALQVEELFPKKPNVCNNYDNKSIYKKFNHKGTNGIAYLQLENIFSII